MSFLCLSADSLSRRSVIRCSVIVSSFSAVFGDGSQNIQCLLRELQLISDGISLKPSWYSIMTPQK